MKQVTYAGTSFTTGTDLADALLRLVEALGASGGSASVQLPAVGVDGSQTTVDLVVGPASEVFAIAIESSAPELEDAATVALFDERARGLGHPKAVPSTGEAASGWDDDALGDLGELGDLNQLR